MAPCLRAFAEGNFPLTSANAAGSVQISITHITIHPQHFTVSHSSFPPAAHILSDNVPLLFIPDETLILFDKCSVHRANMFWEAFVVWKVIAYLTVNCFRGLDFAM